MKNILKCVQKMMLTLVLAGSIVTSGFAQTDASTAGSANESPPLPPVQSQGQTEFMTGGIGLDESEAIKKEARSWPLVLEFARGGGPHAEYISDVQITIKDKSGTVVLDTIAEGPYMLVRLVPGRYSLDASYESVTLRRDLKLEKGQKRKVALIWPGQAGQGTKEERKSKPE